MCLVSHRCCDDQVWPDQHHLMPRSVPIIKLLSCLHSPSTSSFVTSPCAAVTTMTKNNASNVCMLDFKERGMIQEKMRKVTTTFSLQILFGHIIQHQGVRVALDFYQRSDRSSSALLSVSFPTCFFFPFFSICSFEIDLSHCNESKNLLIWRLLLNNASASRSVWCSLITLAIYPDASIPLHRLCWSSLNGACDSSIVYKRQCLHA